jgi:hypothetical protein
MFGKLFKFLFYKNRYEPTLCVHPNVYKLLKDNKILIKDKK